MSDVRLRKPSERTCEHCNRREQWDGEGWRVETIDGEPAVGSIYCIHEWDIDGTFLPFEILDTSEPADA